MNIYGFYTQTDKTKMSKVKDMAIDMNAWAIVLTETWLSQSICDGEVKIEGFNLLELTGNPDNVEVPAFI